MQIQTATETQPKRKRMRFLNEVETRVALDLVERGSRLIDVTRAFGISPATMFRMRQRERERRALEAEFEQFKKAETRGWLTPPGQPVNSAIT